MDKLVAHYEKKARLGILLTVDDMARFCAKSGIANPGRKALESLRYRLRFTAFFSEKRLPLQYMGAAIQKYGTVMVDMGFFRPDLKTQNGGCVAFLVGVECLSSKLSVVPCKNATQRSWERAIVTMLETAFDHISVVVSDRDSSVTGQAFQARMRRDYGLSWIFLKSRSKSYRAEIMIKFVKRRCSIALEAAVEAGERSGKKPNLNWVELLPGILDDYNGREIPGSGGLTRDSVNKRNYMDLLERLWGSRDAAGSSLNLAQSSNYSPRIAKALWRYQVGDRVLLSKASDYSRKTGKFTKRSVTGSFGPEVHTVTGRKLKSNGKYFLVAVYSISGRTSLYYPEELRPALFVPEAQQQQQQQQQQRQQQQQPS